MLVIIMIMINRTATALLAAEIREAATLRVEITDRENEARLKETEMNELWEAMRSELEGSMRREEDALAAFETYKSETLDNGASGEREEGKRAKPCRRSGGR